MGGSSGNLCDGVTRCGASDEMVDGSLCGGSASKERFGVGVEDVEPVGEVGGVVGSGLGAYVELCGGYCCSEFGYEFFGCVFGGAEWFGDV